MAKVTKNNADFRSLLNGTSRRVIDLPAKKADKSAQSKQDAYETIAPEASINARAHSFQVPAYFRKKA